MTYRINFPQVEHVTEEMRTISRNITNLLEALDDSAKSNLAEWTSQAQEAYAQSKRQWDAAAADMVQQSIAAGTTLEQIRATYGQAEVTNSGMWG